MSRVLAVYGSPSVPPNTIEVGDCSAVLHRLSAEPSVRSQVRLAYLDPPFNTGEVARGYVDRFPRDEWKAMMATRFEATWSLLREDGSLWVHCDDAEQATLRVLGDDLFERSSFVGTIVWQRRYSRENRRALSASHDYIHVYAPAGRDWKEHRNRLPRRDAESGWTNPDHDPRGLWSTVSLVAQGGHGTAAQSYTITLPSGRVVEPPQGSCWRLTRPAFEALQEEGLIWFGAAGNNVPRRKVFLTDAKGLVPSTWWPHEEVGHNAEAKAEQRRLHDSVPFTTPKPERLMTRILEIGSDPGDLVLDPFLGSGTTAAVAQKLGRRWYGIEVDERTVMDFVVPRLKAVLDGTQTSADARQPALFDAVGGFAVRREVPRHAGGQAIVSA